MHKLSIVIPVYNKSELTQESILNVTNVCKNIDYEIIVIDDWSSDDTTEIVSSLYAINKNISYYRFEENQWVTVARNTGVDLAQWEFICIINNDVIFPDWFFEKMMSWYKEWIWFINPRFTEWDVTRPSNILYFKNMLCWCCFMFHRKNRGVLFPIDTRMRIFGNDNWLHFRNRELWLKQIVKYDAICHHLKSQTSFFIPNADRPIFLGICEEKWWIVEPVYPLPDNELKEDFIFN